MGEIGQLFLVNPNFDIFLHHTLYALCILAFAHCLCGLIEERQNINETDSYILVSFNVFSAARFEYHIKEIDILEFPNELKNKH